MPTSSRFVQTEPGRAKADEGGSSLFPSHRWLGGAIEVVKVHAPLNPGAQNLNPRALGFRVEGSHGDGAGDSWGVCPRRPGLLGAPSS